jgi:hypothetical protein
VRAENRDVIPQAADFLLTEENVHTVIVYGIVKVEEREMLVGSLRTSKFTLDPDQFIKDTFGKNAEGLPFAPVAVSGVRDGLRVEVDGTSGAVRGHYQKKRRLRWASQVGDWYALDRRHQKAAPFSLPARARSAVTRVDFSIPLVIAIDVGRGAHGDAVQSDGALVGVVVGESQPENGPERRVLALSAPGLLHALDRIYGQKALVDEIWASAKAKR